MGFDDIIKNFTSIFIGIVIAIIHHNVFSSTTYIEYINYVYKMKK